VMLWSTLHHMSRDAKLKPSMFLQLVRQHLPHEKETTLWESGLDYSVGVLANFIPNDRLVPEARLMFDFAWKYLSESKDADQRINLANSLISFAHENSTVEQLLHHIESGSTINGFEFDQAMRWRILIKAVVFGLPGSEEKLAAEEKRDSSDRGQRKLTEGKAAVPKKEVKETAWERILNDKDSSFHTLSSVMIGFAGGFHQRELLRGYDTKYFANVRRVFKERNKEISSSFASNLYPYFPEEDSIVKQTEDLLATLDPKEEQIIIRSLKESMDDMKRAKKCRLLEKL